MTSGSLGGIGTVISTITPQQHTRATESEAMPEIQYSDNTDNDYPITDTEKEQEDQYLTNEDLDDDMDKYHDQNTPLQRGTSSSPSNMDLIQTPISSIVIQNDSSENSSSPPSPQVEEVITTASESFSEYEGSPEPIIGAAISRNIPRRVLKESLSDIQPYNRKQITLSSTTEKENNASPMNEQRLSCRRSIEFSPEPESSQESSDSLIKQITKEELQHSRVNKVRHITPNNLGATTTVPELVQTVDDKVVTHIGGLPITQSILDDMRRFLQRNPHLIPPQIAVGRMALPQMEDTAITPEQGTEFPDRYTEYVVNSLHPNPNHYYSSESDTSVQGDTANNEENTAYMALHSAYLLHSNSTQTPKLFQDIYRAADKEEWLAACNRELKSFKDLKVYQLVPLPPGRKALGVRWVFTVKDSGLKKARLVAQGFRQKAGIDYQETFAPVIRYDSVRIFLALSAYLHLRVHQMDVNTAFLNSRMTDTVYVKQPPGFLDNRYPDHVWKLTGGMYGLKQAPLLWNRHINSSLTKLGFARHPSEYGLYYKFTCSGLVLVALYVDDLLLSAPTKEIMQQVKRRLSLAYSMKDLGPVSKFLGMNVNQTANGTVHLTLADYIVKAASLSEVPTHKNVHTPLSNSVNYFTDKSPLLKSPTPYQSIVGQLLFVANTGRPDIAYSISLLSRFLKSPRQVHMMAAQRIMQYLYTTRNYGLSYQSTTPLTLAIYSDASYGSVSDLPLSTGGYITFLAEGVVSWKSNKIRSVCQSSTEAEYVAASDALREMAWISNLCDEIRKPLKDKVLYVDNQPAIKIAENPVLHDKIKHIQVKYHYIRQQVAEKHVRLQYVPTKNQLADIMTKTIPRTQHEALRNSILKPL